MTDVDLVGRALELGTTYFKSEDFFKANQLFTKAIELARSYSDEELENLRLRSGLPKRCVNGQGKPWHPKYVKLLDNRAASWEKLGKLDKALKDAKNMIRIEPHDLKCYIRCGKILQKLNKDKEAYSNYSQGLKMAKEGYQTYGISVPQKFINIIQTQKQSIKKRHGREQIEKPETSLKRRYIEPAVDPPVMVKTMKKVTKRMGLDFISMLPQELVALILSHLDAKQIISCTMVSKSWHNRIHSLPQLFRDIDLDSSTYRKVSKFQTFANTMYHNHLNLVLNSLKFSSLSLGDEAKSITTIIEGLNLSISKLIIQSRYYHMDSLISNLKKNLNLAKSVRDLSVVCNYRNSSVSREHELLGVMQNLKKLEIIFLETDRSSYTQNFKSNDLVKVEKSTVENLESFKIICDLKKMTVFCPFRKALIIDSQYYGLVKLYVCGTIFDSQMSQFSWLANFPNIEDLYLENNKNAFLYDFLRVLIYEPFLKNLHKLTFREHRISNSAVNLLEYPTITENSTFINNFSNLQVLDLMSSSIGGHGLISILSSLPSNRIRKLNIGDCPFIHFQRSSLPGYLDLSLLLPHIPHIEELFLHQSVALDDYAVQLIAKNIKHIKKLRRLDLSFNTSITGVSIYELVRNLKDREYIILDKLSLDGCISVSDATVNSIRQMGFVKELVCTYEKLTWKKFGVNTFCYT